MKNTVLERTIRNGYILDPAIPADEKTLQAIEKIVGISGEKANAAFHKSWSIIRDAAIEQLVLQQIIHYLTTYGFEQLGVYSESAVYIPHETLEIPEIKEDVPLTVVKAWTADEMLEKIIMLGSGVALAEQTLADVMAIVEFNKPESQFVHKIKNRELKARLYDYYDIVPTEPVEFLRHIVSKLTDESLLIKNNDLIEKIKSSNRKFLDTLLKQAPDNLASIFFRYKPIFLAMKSASKNKTFFNRLRKKAKTLHQPLPVDYLNNVTAEIKRGDLDTYALAQRLDSASIFRKIRLAYALNFRLNPNDSIVYRIRNGRGWATDFVWDSKLKQETQNAFYSVLSSIVDDVRKNVEGKVFYIPANVHYTLPATEKQFTGNMPTGSYVSVPEDLIVGIHWANTEKGRVDLDLSLLGVSGKIGWDSSYRTEKRDILFSGDVTDAPRPKGASELFYIEKGLTEPQIMMVNYYNFEPDNPADCKIMAAHEVPKTLDANYVIDTNNMIATANVNIAKKQNILGLIVSVDGENRFYFTNIILGNSITAQESPCATHAREYLVGNTVNTIHLRDILGRAGAVVVDERPKDHTEYIDLSPEKLDKSTILDIITPRG